MLLINHTPTQKKTHIPFDALASENFIIYPKDFTLHDRIIEECARNGFFPTIACESSQKDLMVELVAAKLGITILPKKICAKLSHDQLIAIPFKNENIFLELGMIWKKNKYLSNAVREFIATVQEDIFST